MTLDWFWPEGFYASMMILAFALGAFALKLPIAVAMSGGAVLGAILAGEGIPVRHLVEGMFGYIDTILIIATAMIFMKTVQAIGLMESIAAWGIRRFRNYPVLLSIGVTLLIMFPGMLTGSSTACCLTTGALVAPVLMHLGVPRVKTGALIAIAALLGMIAPPINIPVMIIGGGIDMPYVGFAVPLLAATMPLAVFAALLLAWPSLRRREGQNDEALEKELARMSSVPLTWRLCTPFAVLVVLMAGEQFMPQYFPFLGMPLQFLIASASAVFTGRRWNVLASATEAIDDALPVLGILMGVGMFIQVMTLNGVRGFVVISALSIPEWALYLSIAVSIPAFGAISSFGAASVLGVPFMFALLAKDQIITATALALIASLGDLVPPTALAGIFAGQVVGEKNYFKILKVCVVPAVAIALWGIAFIAYAGPLASWLRWV
ncbi:MAG: TRAP transporter large permease subunit [Synergistaceae bacterium]|jgi:TRAP-type C4-dicarboxylate transport system permease large subunit|nr:TRAP transporter large permease subunit [Synergistaceae bacterium]